MLELPAIVELDVADVSFGVCGLHYMYVVFVFQERGHPGRRLDGRWYCAGVYRQRHQDDAEGHGGAGPAARQTPGRERPAPGSQEEEALKVIFHTAHNS